MRGVIGNADEGKVFQAHTHSPIRHAGRIKFLRHLLDRKQHPAKNISGAASNNLATAARRIFNS